MNDFLKQIKSACSEDLLYQYENEQLKEMIPLLDQVKNKIKSIISERSIEEDDPNNDFIEIVINGQPDFIKKTIQVLNISCNEFATLPAAIYRLKHLKKLYLYNNQFTPEEKKKIRSSFPVHVQIHF